MTVATLNFEQEYQAIVERNFNQRVKRLRQPLIRIYDGNWVLRGTAAMVTTASFQEIDSETGMGTIDMPVDYYLSAWIINHNARPTKNVHVTVDKDGVRWSGRMDNYEIDKTDSWHVKCRVTFKHDFEELKHILVWANPFLPAEIQFPRMYILFAYRPV